MNEETSVVTVKEWLLYLLRSLIPFYNIYWMFKCCFGNVNKSFKNMMTATVIVIGGLIVVNVLLLILK